MTDCPRLKYALMAGLVFIAQAAEPKPLITSSEETATRLCLEYDDSYERLVILCRQALDDGGHTRSQRSQILSRLGDALRGLDRYDPAEARYVAAIAEDRLNPDPHSGRGWSLWEQDREDEAIPHFRKAISLRPTAQALAGLASSLWGAGQADQEEVMTLLDASLALMPDYGWALREKGWIARDLGLLEESIQSFDAALAVFEDDRNAHYGRSRALADAGRLEEALLAVNSAIDLDPGQSDGYVHRAYVLRRLDRNAQAIPDAERGIVLAPDWPAAHVQKALAEKALGRRGSAIETFAAADTSGVANAFLLYFFAHTLLEDGQLARAEDVIDRSLSYPDADAHDHLLKAEILNARGGYARAIEAADAALVLDPAMSHPHYQAAVALVHIGDLDGGLARFDQAVAAGIETDMIAAFVADLIASGHILSAIGLRGRY